MLEHRIGMASISSSVRRKVKNRINLLAYFLGMDIFTEGYRIFNGRFIAFISMCTAFLICTFYCFIVYAGDLEKKIFYFVTLGLFFKAVTQVACFVGGRQKLYKILAFYEEFYARALELDLEPTLYRFSDYLKKFTTLIQILYLGAVLAAMSNPFIMKVLTGSFVLPFGF